MLKDLLVNVGPGWGCTSPHLKSKRAPINTPLVLRIKANNSLILIGERSILEGLLFFALRLFCQIPIVALYESFEIFMVDI